MAIPHAGPTAKAGPPEPRAETNAQAWAHSSAPAQGSRLAVRPSAQALPPVCTKPREQPLPKARPEPRELRPAQSNAREPTPAAEPAPPQPAGVLQNRVCESACR
jgi:hypothetical protein